MKLALKDGKLSCRHKYPPLSPKTLNDITKYCTYTARHLSFRLRSSFFSAIAYSCMAHARTHARRNGRFQPCRLHCLHSVLSGAAFLSGKAGVDAEEMIEIAVNDAVGSCVPLLCCFGQTCVGFFLTPFTQAKSRGEREREIIYTTLSMIKTK